jgi:hypothetical protein
MLWHRRSKSAGLLHVGHAAPQAGHRVRQLESTGRCRSLGPSCGHLLV